MTFEIFWRGLVDTAALVGATVVLFLISVAVLDWIEAFLAHRRQLKSMKQWEKESHDRKWPL
jgi:hypothetical protein